MSENAVEEDPPREDEPFDFLAKPEKFYMTVETVGSLKPREVITKGLEELQTKLANLIHGLKSSSDEVETMAPNGHMPPPNGAPRTGGWGQPTVNGGAGGWESPSAAGWNI